MFNILPADTYTVINKTILTEQDRKILLMLYQPIIGSGPINLFMTLWMNLDKSEFMSNEMSHHFLITSLKMSIEEITIQREKLEAVGLLKTFVKENNDVNNYIYELFSPLSAADFFSHPILNVVLFNEVSKKEYERLVSFFKIPRIILKDYKDITKSFNDVFDSIPSSSFINNVDVKKINSLGLNMKYNFDFNMLLSSFPKETINNKTFNKENKELIENLSYIYNLEVMEMKDLILSSLNEKFMIDKELLRKNSRNYYQYQNNGKLPTVLFKNQPDMFRSSIKNDSKKSKLIYTFETVSPYNFLKSKYNGSNPTNRDLKLIESLILDVGLTPAVVNVLIDYVMKINNKKLTKNFVETIAGQWKRLDIKTALDAMNQAEKETKNKKKSINKPVYKKKESEVPDWLNQDIQKETISEEEENEVKDLLKEFK